MAEVQRKTNLEGLVLTFNNYTAITPEYAKRCVKRLLEALRRKANREKWSYIIYLVYSTKDPRSFKKVRPHIHLVLYANPCSTIRQWISAYWNGGQGKQKGKRIGIVKHQKLSDYKGFLGYADSQKQFRAREHSHVGNEHLDISRICDYECKSGNAFVKELS